MASTPTVIFIDDSATMREVIKIAFRRENIEVVAYPDAATALPQIEQSKPDVVITDVIMPDKDGYEVCQYIKQHAKLTGTPVILMSGVVNRAVAEKAFSVKADELIRKPFQPQDLITRVKHLLKHEAPVAAAVPAANAAAALSSIFASAPRNGSAARPKATANPTVVTPAPELVPVMEAAPIAVAPPAPAPPAVSNGAKSVAASTSDLTRLKVEVARLEGLVKKLQSELAAEREYVRSLEEHFKTVQQA
ncbi:MAG TPA: response regulator [Terriglobales bacterium]|nr:response regulator [Terriglobales bacterium]